MPHRPSLSALRSLIWFHFPYPYIEVSVAVSLFVCFPNLKWNSSSEIRLMAPGVPGWEVRVAVDRT